MATIVRAQVSMEGVSGVPEDRVVNVFHFSTGDDPSGATLDAIAAALWDFYNDQRAGQGDIAGLIADSVSRAAGDLQFRLYDLADPTPRAPVLVSEQTLEAAASATNLPREASICMSFRAETPSGQVAARRRGRVYIGPLTVEALDDATGRPDSGAMDVIRDAGDDLQAASDAAADWSWVVYSTVNGTGYTVHDGWVDNEFDTQRRRGLRATERLTWA